jgi:hypothetical protein
MTTLQRTVSLTPIKAEVDSYVEWLKSQGFRVTSVKHATLPGYDTEVTFERDQIPETPLNHGADKMNLIALANYRRALQQFETASGAFNAACIDVRNTAKPSTRRAVEIDGEMYLFTVDKDRNFELEKSTC